MIVTPANLCLNNPRGFLVIDGVNGAGKSSLQKRIVDYLKDQNLPVTATREPGGTPLGAELRRIILNAKAKQIAPPAELLLFAADRAEHVAKTIRPALADQKLVICDRYYYSTTAFQGYGRKLNLETINMLNSIAIDGLCPDLTILLDLDPELGLKRTVSRATSEHDGFEEETISFHHALRKGFLETAKTCKEPIVVVDASQPENKVWDAVKEIITLWLKALK